MSLVFLFGVWANARVEPRKNRRVRNRRECFMVREFSFRTKFEQPLGGELPKNRKSF
jgi:hypothetical protein